MHLEENETEKEQRPEDNTDRAPLEKIEEIFHFHFQKLREAAVATRPTTPSRPLPGNKLVPEGVCLPVSLFASCFFLCTSHSHNFSLCGLFQAFSLIGFQLLHRSKHYV